MALRCTSKYKRRYMKHMYNYVYQHVCVYVCIYIYIRICHTQFANRYVLYTLVRFIVEPFHLCRAGVAIGPSITAEKLRTEPLPPAAPVRSVRHRVVRRVSVAKTSLGTMGSMGI